MPTGVSPKNIGDPKQNTPVPTTDSNVTEAPIGTGTEVRMPRAKARVARASKRERKAQAFEGDPL